MNIPSVNTAIHFFLGLFADNTARTKGDAMESLAEKFNLTEAERAATLPSSGHNRVENVTRWSLHWMKTAKLLDKPKRGLFQISKRGMEFYREGHDSITLKMLQTRYIPPKATQVGEGQEESSESAQADPRGMLETSHQEINDALAQELLERVISMPPRFFEHLVVKLLLAMGYGNSRENAGTVLGGSGDGGIDGVINVDQLGLDEAIYIQAKRWTENLVREKDLRDFVGGLEGVNAKRGVFITTSDFDNRSRAYVKKINHKKVILINGERLARLMIDHNVGVTIETSFHVKKVDSNYFSEEDY